jgi:hypothetical protein
MVGASVGKSVGMRVINIVGAIVGSLVAMTGAALGASVGRGDGEGFEGSVGVREGANDGLVGFVAAHQLSTAIRKSVAHSKKTGLKVKGAAGGGCSSWIASTNLDR